MVNHEKWDNRFLNLAKEVASWSKDPSTKVGAVIVRVDNTIASVGYNGFPSIMPDNPEWLNNREEKYPRTVHAELNAILHSRERLAGYSLYTTAMPCAPCAVHAIQAGIRNFIYLKPTADLIERWGKSFEKTYQIFNDCLVNYREY